MISSTFQLVSGLGPKRERQLWAAGVRRWDELPAGGCDALPVRLLPSLTSAITEAQEALQARDVQRLVRLLPPQERWRLFEVFQDDTLYLDIETDYEEGITAIGLLDGRGPRILLAGPELASFPELTAGARLLVTFNGCSFDVPVLRRVFPEWVPPPAHVDLRHVWRRLGHHGGLKALEDAVGIGRPLHLRGLNGAMAVGLWRRAQYGDARALRLFAEYNLYDAINLRTLMGLAYNALAERAGVGAAPVMVSQRGDVLYDLTRELLRIVPEAA